MSRLNIKTNADDSLSASKVVAVLTEWDEFKYMNYSVLIKIIDGRNILDIFDGIDLHSIGKINDQ